MPKPKIKPIKHIHLYKKVNLVPKWKKSEPFWVMQCQKPLCSHWLRLDLCLNKMCECNRCHEPMILNKHSLTLVKPHHDECIVKKNKNVELISQNLDDLLGDI